MERLARRAAEVDAEQAQEPVPTAVMRAAASNPHIETVDRLRRLADPCGRESVEAVAAQVARQLGDEHSIAYHRSICERIANGSLPLKTVISAYRQARFGTGHSPGAIFTAFIRDHSPPGRKKRPPGPHANVPRGSSVPSRSVKAIRPDTSIHGG